MMCTCLIPDPGREISRVTKLLTERDSLMFLALKLAILPIIFVVLVCLSACNS